MRLSHIRDLSEIYEGLARSMPMVPSECPIRTHFLRVGSPGVGVRMMIVPAVDHP